MARILIVDDNPENLHVLSDMLALGEHEVLVALNGEEALRRMEKSIPDIVLLDVMMPVMDGFATLKAIKDNPLLNAIPVILITALSSEESIRKGFDLGAVDYITKPFYETEVMSRMGTHLRLCGLLKELEDKVEKQTVSIQQLNISFVMALEKANYYNDDDTGAHIKRVCHYSRLLAGAMHLPPEFCEDLFRYASLHDVGKVGIPDNILKKPGKLTREEFDKMKEHSYIGFKMIDDPEIPQVAKNIVLYHHEKFDGSGYPEGLKGEAIPLEARIMAVADVYDALRAKRPYKDPFTREKAESIIQDSVGSHFDPAVIEVFEKRQDAFNDIFDSFTD